MKVKKSYKSITVVGLAAFLVLVGCENSNSADDSTAEKTTETLVKKVGDVDVAELDKVEAVIEAGEPVVIAAAEETTAEVSTEAVEETTTKAVTTTEHIINMVNNGDSGMMVFEPAFLKVNKGDTVKFVAVDVAHDSVSVFTPEGAAGWKGENSKDVVATLDVEGVYIYKCTPHAMMGMVGVIQVGEATNKADAEKAAAELAVTIAMNKERLPSYMAEIK